MAFWLKVSSKDFKINIADFPLKSTEDTPSDNNPEGFFFNVESKYFSDTFSRESLHSFTHSFIQQTSVEPDFVPDS